MNCPKCDAFSLRKKGYDSPYNCNNCGGMWLDFEKIPSFFESIRLEKKTEVFDNINDHKAGFCPSGHGLLIRAKIEDTHSPFYLEKCPACGGIWFDNDEWLRIIDNNLVDNLNDIWCSFWQTQQRKKKSRDSYLEVNRKVLGDAVFSKIIELSEVLRDHPESGRALALLQQEMKSNHR